MGESQLMSSSSDGKVASGSGVDMVLLFEVQKKGNASGRCCCFGRKKVVRRS